MRSKPCNTCHISKPLTDYNKDRGKKDGRMNICVVCRKKNRQGNAYHHKVRRGIVYCIECEGFYKIGVTSSGLKARVSTIQTGNPFPVNILWIARTNDIGRYERMLHEQIKDNNVRGEWYDIPRVLALELRKQVKHDS